MVTMDHIRQVLRWQLMDIIVTTEGDTCGMCHKDFDRIELAFRLYLMGSMLIVCTTCKLREDEFWGAY